MIYLYTASPGGGKTLSALEYIETVQRETPERLIYAANIDGLCMPGVLPLDDDGVHHWWEVCERGSLVVIDEAQKYWRARRSGDLPKAVEELETHRHDGIDVLLMTQHPTFLHANVRKLVSTHIHLVAYTGKSSLRWEWRECHDDVQEEKLRASGEFKEWFYPSRLYPFYKSATLHTKRVKRSWKQVKGRIALCVAVVLALGVIGVAAHIVRKGMAARALGAHSRSVALQSGPGGLGPSPDVRRPVSVAQYVSRQLPRVASQPWSAPIYDQAAAVRHIRVWCIAPVSKSKRCLCITDEGTRYSMEQATCRVFAENGGSYDPYLPEPRDDAPSRLPSDAQPVGTAQSFAQAVGLPVAPGVAGVSPAGHAVVGGAYNPGVFGPSSASESSGGSSAR